VIGSPPHLTRATRETDIDALIGLMRAFYEESSDPLDADWAAASFRAPLAQPALGAVRLAQAEGSAVGHALLTVRHAMEFGGPRGAHHSRTSDDVLVTLRTAARNPRTP
jgi:hypothetical protein